jgi:hypothetical protein
VDDDANLCEEKRTHYHHPYRSNKSEGEEALLKEYITQATISPNKKPLFCFPVFKLFFV